MCGVDKDDSFVLVWHGIYFSRPYTEKMVGRASRPMQMSHVEEQLVGELLAAGGGADHGRGLFCLSPPAARVVVLHSGLELSSRLSDLSLKIRIRHC